MQYTAPHLRAQNTILDELEARLRDTSNARWTDAELYRAINDALLRWSGRVSIPYLYTLSGGWVSGTYEYSVPDYLGTRIQPQRRVLSPYIDTTTNTTQYVWADVRGWDLDPDGSGGQNLRTQWNEGTPGTTSDARILWWGENGPVPVTIPTVQTEIDSDDTSLVLSAVVDVGQSGYVKVDAEWIQWSGYSDDGSNTTLTNLVRAVNGTTAATHTASTSVYVGVAMPELRLLEQLYHQAMANAYAYGLTDINETERDRYERNMGYYQQLAEEFWMRWTPTPPRMRLTRRAVGS